MPFIPILNTVQAELVYTWNQQTCQNVLHFEASGSLSVDNMLELGAHLVDWYDVHMQPLHHNSCRLNTIRLTDMTVEFAPALDYTVSLPLVGTIGGNSMPNNVSLSLTKRTIYRGRNYRGRVYQVGLAEEQVDGNTVLSGPVGALIAAWEQLLAFTTTSESWEMVVASKYQGNVARPEAVTTPVINFSSDGIVDSQRRRLPGRGN